MIVAFYHVDYGDESYYRCAEIMVQSAKRLGAEVWMLTDSQSREVPGVDRVLRTFAPIPREKLNSTRIMMMTWLLEALPEGAEVVFVDTDVVLNEVTVFEWKNFDVCLTARTTPLRSMPFNFGVIFARANTRSIAFFDYVARIALGLPLEMQAWYADQLALIIAIGWPDYADNPATYGYVVHDTGAHVWWLPCEQYNFSPEEPPEEIRPIVHFKGPHRKAWMEDYWKRVSPPLVPVL